MPSKSLLLWPELFLWGILEQKEQTRQAGGQRNGCFFYTLENLPSAKSKRGEDHECNCKAHNL
jgi:hypothetical protein